MENITQQKEVLELFTVLNYTDYNYPTFLTKISNRTLDNAESGIYVTAHGEAGRPEYTIVK